jgi:hypothetical protein
MADTKISALASGDPAQGSDEYVVARSGANYKLTLSNIASRMPDTTVYGGLVVNESGADKDTRIEGDTDANLLFVDASTDRIGVGTATPAQKFDLSTGNMAFSGTAQRILIKGSGSFADRTVFQNITANSETRVSVIPSGTGDIASFSLANTSTPTGSGSAGSLRIDSDGLNINSVALNAGVDALPIVFQLTPTGSADVTQERMRLTVDGKLGINTQSPGSELDVKGTVRLSGSSSGYVGLAPAAAAGSTTYTLPSADGSNGQILSTNGSGTLSWATASGTGDVVGPASSTDEALARFDSTTGKLLQNSNATLTDAGALTLTNGAVINEAGADSDTRIEGDTDANLVFVDASTDRVGMGTSSPGSKLDVKGTLRLSGSSSGYVGIAPAAAAGSTTYTLPSADGSSGQVLSTNGSGTLSWASAGAGTVTSVGGTGTVNGITLTGTVTSSGNLTLGGTLTGVDLTSQVTGTLPVANGGTGQTTYTNGQLLIGNTTGNTLTKATLTAGSGISITNGTGSITIAATGGSGTVTSVSGTGTVNGLTLTGTVTSSGSLTLGGTLDLSSPPAIGGTAPNTGAFTSITSTSASGILTRAAATQDAVEIIGRAGGTSSYKVTLTPTTLSASRTLTLPDVSGTVLTTGAAVTVAQGGTGITSGTSGGVPYFSGSTTIASSAALAANALVIGGGAGAAPSTTTTGTGILTFLGTPSSANLAAAVTDETGSGALVFATSPTLVTPVLGTPTSGNLNSCTADGTNKVGYRNIPAVGTKTGSYTLATGDVGKYVQVGTGGSITIPDATFAEGDVVSIFNNTTGAITITCTITTAYIAGTDTDKASVSLATRGVATILFISGTVCVISGNVS